MAITINGTSNTITGLAAGGLPDDSINLADLSATGTASSSTFLRGDNSWAAAGGGIKHCSEWRISTAYGADSAFVLTSNWEEADDASYTRLGSAITESSGIFTLPEAGIWRIDFLCLAYQSNALRRYFEGLIQVSTDSGSNWDSRALAQNNTPLASNDTSSGSAFCSTIQDVTDASTFRIRFYFSSVADMILYGTTTVTQTGAIFTRLGDT